MLDKEVLQNQWNYWREEYLYPLSKKDKKYCYRILKDIERKLHKLNG